MAKFRKIKSLDQGGQGQVWLAERVEDHEPVAMKYLIVDPADPNPEEAEKRFAREIRCQSTLDHPNIIEILGWNLSASPPWYVMPLADSSLRKMITPGTAMDQDEGLSLFRHVLAAIEYAHAEGVLHRDLKPENILIKDRRPIVADFGLSRRVSSGSTTLTVTNAGMGTLQYSAPEQFTDAHSADERADVYALGKILFEILTGVMPFPYADLSLAPAQFRYVIGRCLENNPDARYPSVAELARELELLLDAPDDLDPPLQRAQALLVQVLAGDRLALADLDKLLQSNGDDEVLYKKFMPFMQRPVLAVYLQHHRAGFISIVKQFLTYAEGGHPWSYTDHIADFLANVFDLLDDHLLRRAILERVLVLGYDHNRFHVGDVFVRLVHTCTDPSDVLLAAEVLRKNPEAARFVADGLRQGSLPLQIAQALPSAS